ncbi:uncharacterized protein METZ01_LOCUS160405 [marine metagenome]|uniref:Uncharacterized protein n=1 Tax=marine metagenome TaxID=408172 RepID=A0A382B209_9ZZZZ
MATFTSDAISGNSAFQNFPQGNLGVRVANYSIGAALAANDIIQMCDVFAGETVYGVMLTAPDLDTGGSPAIVLDVGYGGAAASLIDGSTIGQAGGTASSLAIGHATHGSTATAPVAFTADDTIDVTVQVAPATGATSGTLTMYLIVG